MGRVALKIKNLTLKKTLILYLCIALTLSFFLSATIMSMAEKVQKKTWFKYIDEDFYFNTSMMANKRGFDIDVPRISSSDLTDLDNNIVETCDFIDTWTPLILATLAAGIAVLLFYRDKLKKPIAILEESSDKIAVSSLDFQIDYDSKDEMGRLCQSFEHMRGQLSENNKHLWKMIEEQKNLRAAIAHDIRAPLAVLQGYHEMMLTFVPDDRISKEKLIEMLQASESQIERLNVFVETMRNVSSVENRRILYDNVDITELHKLLSTTVAILIGEKELQYDIIMAEPLPISIRVDKSVILEVFENITANAIRYASNKIQITIKVQNDVLQISISDDGKGFREENIEEVTKAYYHDNQTDDLSHFGLGLYLCKVLCEKHEGKLLLKNDKAGGACVKAIFGVRKV